MSNEIRLLTIAEAAERFRCEPETIRKWIRDGRLPAARTPGGRFLIAEPDLLLALEPARRPGQGGRR